MEHTLLFLLLLITLPLFSMDQNDQLPINSLSIKSQDGKLLDDKKLKKEEYDLYKGAIELKDRKERIEKIKNFHEKHAISYDKKYYISTFCEGYPENGPYPIDWALRWNEPDFALFLLKEKKVDVKDCSACDENKIHYLARGIGRNEFNDKHVEILMLLIEGKAAINSINHWGRAPLAEYITQANNKNFSLDNRLLKSFFTHGAHLFCEQLYQGYEVLCNGRTEEARSKLMKRCNLLATVLNRHKFSDNKKYRIIAIAMLLKERLACAKKSYFDRLLIFKALNQKFIMIGMIPKPIRHMIINMAAQQEEIFTDIRNSISEKSNVRLLEFDRWSDYVTVNYSQPLYTVVKEPSALQDSKALCAMLSLEFWNRSLKTCLEDLGSIIE